MQTLGNISACSAASDRALLLASDSSSSSQVSGQAGDTTHELTMIAGAYGAFCHKVRDCAASCGQGIRDPRIAAINNNSGAQIRSRTRVVVIGDAVVVACDCD